MEIWLDWARMGCRIGYVVDLVALEFCLGWVGHLVGLDIWLGLSFSWVSHMVVLYIWLGKRFGWLGLGWADDLVGLET